MSKRPKEPRSAGDKVRLAIQAVAALVALGALGMLVWTWWGYRQSARAFEELQQQYTAPAATPEVEEEAGPALLEVDFEALREVDFDALRQDWPDVVAWIQWPLMGIDFPIVHGSSNTQYLRALPDGSWNNGGSIFLEANNQSIDDWHAIVYGHNMRDGSMFGMLKSYLEESFFAENGGEASFILYTPEGVWQYDVFSIEKVMSTDPGVYMVGYLPGEEFTAFVQGMKDRSLYDMGVEADGTLPVMTLSTCNTVGAAQGHRVVLHAVRGQRLDEA